MGVKEGSTKRGFWGERYTPWCGEEVIISVWGDPLCVRKGIFLSSGGRKIIGGEVISSRRALSARGGF